MMRKEVVITLIIGLVFGYFIGREHLKYEMSSAINKAFSGFASGLETGKKTLAKQNKPDPKLVEIDQKKSEEILKEKTNYIKDFIQLYDITSKYAGDVFGATYPAVFGKVKNVGEKTLKNVEITAYFLDKDDKVIFEKSYHPVYVSQYSTRDNLPLKPNYIKEFGYKAEGLPSEWAEGKAKVAITDIEFE